jgi:hypothetical protein
MRIAAIAVANAEAIIKRMNLIVAFMNSSRPFSQNKIDGAIGPRCLPYLGIGHRLVPPKTCDFLYQLLLRDRSTGGLSRILDTKVSSIPSSDCSLFSRLA